MTNEVKVKICGITRERDARICVEEGVHYIGLIFAPSERNVSLARAAEIRQAAPEAKLVGVFAGHTDVEIAEAARVASLDMLQLHGGEPLPLRNAVRERTGLPVARVVHAGTIIEAGDPFVDDRLLYDLPKGQPHTNQDMRCLWQAARDGAAAHQKVFLAGGLHPGNVAEAITTVRPYAVDVSRGVETAPGRKDAGLIRSFLEGVRRG